MLIAGLVVAIPAAPASAMAGPTLAVTTPVPLSNHPAPTLSMTGTADDPNGVDQIVLALKHRDTDTWYDPNDPDPRDGYGPDYRSQEAVLDSPGATSLNWSLDYDNLAVGDYGLSISGFDSQGNRSQDFILFTVTEPIRLISPAPDSTVDPRSSLSGTATTLAGVSEVTVRLRNVHLGRIFDILGPNTMVATLVNPGATTSRWSIPNSTLFSQSNLWGGKFLATITLTDTEGNSTITTEIFFVEATGPLPRIIYPISNEVVDSSTLLVNGIARDDVELTNVLVAVRRDDNTWLQADGTYGPSRSEMSATTTRLNRLSTDWRYRVRFDGPGTYRIFVVAESWDGQIGQRSSDVRVVSSIPSGNPGKLSIIMSRSLWGLPTDCPDPTTLDPQGKTILDVANALQARGLVATMTASPDRHSQSTQTCVNPATYTSSWNTIAQLRDSYGWTMMSHGQSYTPLTSLGRTGQFAQSCGSLTDLAAQGHQDAWGLFAYPNNKLTESIQRRVIETCFAYGRRYAEAYNPPEASASQGFIDVASVNGGHCNVVSAPCYDKNLTPARRPYSTVEHVVDLLNSPDDHWSLVQFYKFVEGVDLEGPKRWDCTSPNPDLHWTNQGETYCWVDFLAALDQIESDIVMTDPATEAIANGITNPEDDKPVIRRDPADLTVTAGDRAVFSVGAGGTAPLAYQWKRDGVDLAGETNATLRIDPTQLTDDGAVFSVRVSNGAGSMTSADATLSVASLGTALYVSGSPTLFAPDKNLRDQLVDLGFDVTVVDDDVVTQADANGVDLVLISSAIDAQKVSGTFATTAVPVIVWEPYIFNAMGLSTEADQSAVSYNHVEIVDPSHPLAAGLAGRVHVNIGRTPFNTLVPAAGATIVAETTPGAATITAFDAGDALVTGTAQAKRATLFFSYTTAKELTADGSDLFDAAVLWAVS